MSVKTCNCVTVLCDRCGDSWWNEGDEWQGVAHYNNQDQAFAELAGQLGWRITTNKQLCPDCSKDEDCERNGHLMMSWQTCWCRNTASATNPVADPEPTCGHLWRQCTHCGGAYEKVSFNTIPTV